MRSLDRYSRHPALRAAAGVSLCSAAAGLVAAAEHGQSATWIPFAFVLVVVVVAYFLGSMAGILGSIAAAVIFAFWLYAPLGSMSVENATARANVGWLILAGISLSFLIASPPEQHQ